jgi:transposase
VPTEAAKSVDIKEIVTHLRQLLTEGRTDEALEQVACLLTQMRDQNNALQIRLLKTLRLQFGRKSEKLSPDQLALVLEKFEEAQAIVETPAAPPEAPAQSAPSTPSEPVSTELPAPKPKPRKGHGRKPLPTSLPREVRPLQVPAAERSCTLCGREKPCIGYERSEMLEFVPAGFKVIVNAREKLACRACEGDVVIAPAADKLIDGGLPGPGLLAQVLVAKYGEHLPLNRQSQIYKRHGVELRVSTLADWVTAATDALAPLAKAILDKAMVAHVLQSDDTGLCVLDRDHPNGSKRGHVWFYVGDMKWAAFVYTPDWKAEGPQSVLAERRGWLLVDGYAGYGALFRREGATAVEVGCWAHSRRYFFEALKAGDERAAVAIDLIGKLFAVDRQAKEDGVGHEELLIRRQRDAAPVLEKLGRWMADLHPRLPPKSSLAQAIGYTVRRWTALSRFLEDGRLPLHNGLSELQARQVAVGRKNYLFAGSDKGAERAAIAYTLISTCMLNGVEPWSYLRDVLDKLAAGWPQRRLDELLPPNWAQQQAQQQASTAPASLVPT